MYTYTCMYSRIEGVPPPPHTLFHCESYTAKWYKTHIIQNRTSDNRMLRNDLFDIKLFGGIFAFNYFHFCPM